MSDRVVVCSLGGSEDPWLLPASTPSLRSWIHGGERTLYEFATAAASSGFEVELRGEIHLESLRAMTEAVGVQVTAGDLAPRRPKADEIVLIPEGWTDPMQYMRVAFSPARAMLLICGPPGLVGWDFTPDWAPPDLASVPTDSVARPETFAAIHAMGFELLTNTRALAETATRSGTDCTFIGSGRPIDWPEPIGERDYDLVVVGQNRWAASARAIAASVPGASVTTIPECAHQDLIRQLGSARILVWTGRIEGNARPLNECRAMGTVPIAIRTPMLRELDEDRGAVLVDTLEQMPAAIAALLADDARLATLAERGKRAARELTSWTPFVNQVGRALSAPIPNPGQATREAIGLALDAALGGASAEQLTDDSALRRAYEALRHRNYIGRAALADRVQDIRLELALAHREINEAEGSLLWEISQRDKQLARLQATRTFRYTAPLRAPYEWFRRFRKMNEP